MSTKLDKTDIALKENIAVRIKELREATGVRLSKFASDNDIEKQVQSRIEGGRGATIYTVNKFCKSVGISLSKFFDAVGKSTMGWFYGFKNYIWLLMTRERFCRFI